jgi:hypothetical protein
MIAGFRSWLYRWMGAFLGLIGIVLFLSAAELSRFYGFSSWSTSAFTGLGLSFLLFMSAFLGVWSWKRYSLFCLIGAVIIGLPYLALRPEMLRDDVLKQLQYPPLTVDLLFYRGIALNGDPERELKIERLQFIYGFVRTYGTNASRDMNNL